MTHSDQSTNDIDGDVTGTSFQAGSIAFNLGEPGKPRRGTAFWIQTATAAVAVAGASALALTLTWPDEPTMQTPVAATNSTSAEPGTTTPPSSTGGAPATTTVIAAGRPTQPGTTPRLPRGAPTAVTPTTTTTTVVAAAAPPPPPAGNGVRFSGTVPFGSYNLDLARPRDMDGKNVWPLTPGRLHGDEGYWLAEWTGDGVPGQAECTADLAQRATRDAENLVAGSRVCGRTPGGRIFLVDVAALDSATITGQVTVWE